VADGRSDAGTPAPTRNVMSVPLVAEAAGQQRTTLDTLCALDQYRCAGLIMNVAPNTTDAIDSMSSRRDHDGGRGACAGSADPPNRWHTAAQACQRHWVHVGGVFTAL